jgi:ribosome maturation factor RimP
LCFRGVFTSRTELARVRAAAERVARSYGLEIFDVQLRREPVGIVLRVVIDRPDPGFPTSTGTAASTDGAGNAPAIDAEALPGPAADSIGVADCQRVSQDLSALLDVEEDELGEAALGQAYTLEVSSPGLDRPLRHEADYRRFAGRLAKIVTTAPVDGQSAFAGRLAGVDGGFVLVQEGRKVHRVPVAHIKRGRLEVEF